jgi:hypothetical protein
MKRKIYQIPFFSGLFVLAVVGSCRSESETPNVQETADMRISPADFARPADSISQPVGTMNDSIITNPGTPIDPPLPPKR